MPSYEKIVWLVFEKSSGVGRTKEQADKQNRTHHVFLQVKKLARAPATHVLVLKHLLRGQEGLYS